MPWTIRIVLGILACYRLAQLLVMDDGPWDIFEKIRERVGVYNYGEDGQPDSPLGKLFDCVYCMGFWMAWMCAILVLWETRLTDALLILLGIWGGQTILECLKRE